MESVWLWRISEAITGEGVTNLSWKPKLLFWIMCPVSFWFFFFTEGSFTDFNISLASFLFLHASVRLTSGQTPKASNFTFPINGYFILQYMFPLWSRSRKRYTHKWSAWASWFYILYKIILKCVQTLPSSVITITKWLQTFRLLTVTQICSFNLVYNKPKTNFGLLFHWIQNYWLLAKFSEIDFR